MIGCLFLNTGGGIGQWTVGDPDLALVLGVDARLRLPGASVMGTSHLRHCIILNAFL